MSASLTARTLARPSFEAAFAPPACIAAMLAFESALASAQAAEGLIAPSSAGAIAAACAAMRVDVDAMVAEGKLSATLAVPLVKLLRAEVTRRDAAAAAHVHCGATSQDVLDTAMALCLRPCLDEADRSAEGAARGLARLAREHRDTPMLGRTLLQPAIPITAGLKLARWALALHQDRERLAQARAAGLAVQLGGAVGALEALGSRGAAVRRRMALELGLADARAWHVHRNAWLDLLGRVAQLVLTAGKIARDVALLSQPEVGEMLEAPPREGVGASSAMPHKRNPVACVHGAAAAIAVPGLLATLHASGLVEHERALGGWQAELAVVPQIAAALGTSLDFLDTIGGSLVVRGERMRANVAAYGEPGVAATPGAAVDEVLGELSAYLS